MSLRKQPLERPLPKQYARLFRVIHAEGATFAGGFVRWLASPRLFPMPFNDIDILPIEADSFERVLSAIETTLRLKIEKRTDTAITYVPDVVGPSILQPHGTHRFPKEAPRIQLLKPDRFPGETLGERLSKFDLTICQAALVDETTALVHHRFHQDEMDGQIVFASEWKIDDAFNRVAKYSRKGYHFQPSEGYKLWQAWESLDAETKQAALERFSLDGDY